jgi:hypothetical protein
MVHNVRDTLLYLLRGSGLNFSHYCFLEGQTTLSNGLNGLGFLKAMESLWRGSICAQVIMPSRYARRATAFPIRYVSIQLHGY